jgi:hypothetical protein
LNVDIQYAKSRMLLDRAEEKRQSNLAQEEKKMGTGKLQREKIPEVVKELEDFQKRIWSIMGGDDSLFDHFDRARKRMEQLADPGYTGLGPDGRSRPDDCIKREIDTPLRTAAQQAIEADNILCEQLTVAINSAFGTKVVSRVRAEPTGIGIKFEVAGRLDLPEDLWFKPLSQGN